MKRHQRISPALSLDTAAARNLATTTKSEPQMQGISPRWLLKMLPWVEVSAGTYRVNRRMKYLPEQGRASFIHIGSELRVVPPSLREIPVLSDFGDTALLEDLAARFVQRDFDPGQVFAEPGQLIDEIYLIAHGKISTTGTGEYGGTAVIAMLAEGDYLGSEALTNPAATWQYTIKAATSGTFLVLARHIFQEFADRSESLSWQIQRYLAATRHPVNRDDEADVELTSGHTGEQRIHNTFVDYELAPREYDLSVAQTILRVHTRVADLYNDPMDQTAQQLRLTIDALRERQEFELVNNREFGLLHNVAQQQRIPTRSGPPTPDDLDELVSLRRGTRLFLAHPRAIAAFGRECNRRGISPSRTEIRGHAVLTWREVPILPCDKIPITSGQTSSILAMRTGEDDEGVIGLHQTGIPCEYEPGLNVRFMGINDQAVTSCLISVYYSAAVLVPDALGVLDNVEITPSLFSPQ